VIVTTFLRRQRRWRRAKHDNIIIITNLARRCSRRTVYNNNTYVNGPTITGLYAFRRRNRAWSGLPLRPRPSPLFFSQPGHHYRGNRGGSWIFGSGNDGLVHPPLGHIAVVTVLRSTSTPPHRVARHRRLPCRLCENGSI